jgi:hypothetical protein
VKPPQECGSLANLPNNHTEAAQAHQRFFAAFFFFGRFFGGSAFSGGLRNDQLLIASQFVNHRSAAGGGRHGRANLWIHGHFGSSATSR